MDETGISRHALATALARTADGLRQHVDELRDLDAALGDGDLGVTVDLGSRAMSAYLASNSQGDSGRMLVQLGMHVNRVNPSTFGTLLASAFMGAGKVVQDRPELKAADLGAMGDAAIDAVQRRGKAGAGDKTMLDALIPAVEAFRRTQDGGGNLLNALQAASEASEEGMKATAAMKAKFGRASWRPDGGVGLRDGGAAAMHLLVSGFAENLGRFLGDGRD